MSLIFQFYVSIRLHFNFYDKPFWKPANEVWYNVWITLTEVGLIFIGLCDIEYVGYQPITQHQNWLYIDNESVSSFESCLIQIHVAHTHTTHTHTWHSLLLPPGVSKPWFKKSLCYLNRDKIEFIFSVEKLIKKFDVFFSWNNFNFRSPIWFVSKENVLHQYSYP